MASLYINIEESLVTSRKELVLDSILGPCVLVVIYGKTKCGVYHCLHRYNAEKTIKSLCLKINEKNLKAKLFGGANISKSDIDFGKLISNTVKYILESLNIKIVETDLGGDQIRKIIFNAFTFNINVKTLE